MQLYTFFLVGIKIPVTKGAGDRSIIPIPNTGLKLVAKINPVKNMTGAPVINVVAPIIFPGLVFLIDKISLMSITLDFI